MLEGIYGLSRASCHPILPVCQFLFKEFAVTAWYNPECGLPPSLDFYAFNASKRENCILGGHWTPQSFSGIIGGWLPNNQNQLKSGSKWLHSSRLPSARALKITPFQWGSLDLLRSVLLSNAKIKVIWQWESSPLKSTGSWANDLHNRERGRCNWEKETVYMAASSGTPSGAHTHLHVHQVPVSVGVLLLDLRRHNSWMRDASCVGTRRARNHVMGKPRGGKRRNNPHSRPQ